MKRRCPICQAYVEEDMVKICQESEEWILESIKRTHPQWVEKDGSYSECLEYYKQLGKTEIEKTP